MAAQNKFTIKNITPAVSPTWVELTCPALCNYVEIVNQCTVDIKFRTNSSDATTEITIPANDSYIVHTPVYDYTFRNTRFIIGNTMGYAQLSASGSGNVVGVFIL